MDPIEYHQNLKGKIEIKDRAKIKNKTDLSLAYTPGVAKACAAIDKDKNKVKNLTRKQNSVAVVTDGSAVLGMGDIGAEASIPVMEGKSVLFKEFGNVDAFPLPIKTKEAKEIIQTVENIAPMFGGINLEDIAAPKCFNIEQELRKRLDIPVFHDDQHGTAIAVLAGLYNSLKIIDKKLKNSKVVISGVGAAGAAITKLLLHEGVGDIILVDSKGVICEERDNLNFEKKNLLKKTNKDNICGDLRDATNKADVFIGVSAPDILKSDMVKNMSENPIIFALANPDPEITPGKGKAAGAKIVSTGRSDFSNQINNALVFPGLFRGLLDKEASNIDYDMKVRVAKTIANQVNKPTPDKIIPDVLNKEVANQVAEAV